MIDIREILFKGKEKETGKWVYGYFRADTADCSLKKEGKCFCAHNGSLCWIIEWDDAFHEYDEKEVIPETVSQYTGLIDKNGNKIFAGDIVTLDEDVKKTFNVSDGEVKYGRGGFHVNTFGLLNSLNAIASAEWVLRGEVTGNIHDNNDNDESRTCKNVQKTLENAIISSNEEFERKINEATKNVMLSLQKWR